MSRRVDEGYSERLEKACRFAGVEYGPTALGLLIDENKQTVHHWISGNSVPSLSLHFKLSRKLGVDPEWLATGEGPPPDAALHGSEARSVTKATKSRK